MPVVGGWIVKMRGGGAIQWGRSGEGGWDGLMKRAEEGWKVTEMVGDGGKCAHHIARRDGECGVGGSVRSLRRERRNRNVAGSKLA